MCSIAHDKLSRIVFLMKTKVKSIKMEYVKRRLGFDGCFSVNALGRKECFTLLWKKKSWIHIFNFSQYHIYAWVEVEDSLYKWMIIGFYGEPNTNWWHNSWSLLQSLQPQGPLLWMTIGDYNEILLHKEKKGGKQMKEDILP